jgi:hypothetical protein
VDFFAQVVRGLLNYLNREEVMRMAEKKNGCGCGCIPLKQPIEKPAKGKKEIKKSK